MNNITINSNITDEEISKFKNNDNLTIIIENDEEFEEDYYKKIKKIIKKIDGLNINITIKIECHKRSLFNKYFSNMEIKNINLLINNDSYDYSYEEYLEEESILNSMLEELNSNICTPFEKYVWVYNIVKNFKQYKEEGENEDKHLSRNIKHILKNDYIVCVGYAKLFKELLDKVGIEAQIYNTSFDTSYDNGFTLEDKPLNFEGHSRLLVNLVDPKYNIDGFYISDPTWDNNDTYDLYGNMIMPFDYMQKSKELFKLEDIDYFLDVHSSQEFHQKIKILAHKIYEQKRKNQEDSNNPRQKYENDILETHYYIINLILNTIKNIDYDTYLQLYEIWNEKLYNENNFEIQINNFNNFINYISPYIVKKSNNEIDTKTIINAIIAVKLKANEISFENIAEYIDKLEKSINSQSLIERPYTFPDDYLKDTDDGITVHRK